MANNYRSSYLYTDPNGNSRKINFVLGQKNHEIEDRTFKSILSSPDKKQKKHCSWEILVALIFLLILLGVVLVLILSTGSGQNHNLQSENSRIVSRQKSPYIYENEENGLENEQKMKNRQQDGKEEENNDEVIFIDPIPVPIDELLKQSLKSSP